MNSPHKVRRTSQILLTRTNTTINPGRTTTNMEGVNVVETMEIQTLGNRRRKTSATLVEVLVTSPLTACKLPTKFQTSPDQIGQFCLFAVVK